MKRSRASIILMGMLLSHQSHGQSTSSPLAPYSPRNAVEVQTETTSPSFKTYYDELNDNLVTLDSETGFLYRNPGTTRLEAVLQEGPVTLKSEQRIATYDDGIPQSQRGNFSKQETPFTSSDFITVSTQDTGQTISYMPSSGELWKNPASNKWEARLREPPRADSSSSGSSTPTLGDQLAAAVLKQFEKAIVSVNRNNAAAAGLPPSSADSESRRSRNGTVKDHSSNRSQTTPSPTATPYPTATPAPYYPPIYYPPGSHGHR